MVEILWNSESPHVPTRDHELYELRMVDLGDTAKPRFIVREIHASWSASAQQTKWSGYQDETCGTPEDAQHRFERRKAIIVRAGFAYTTQLG